MEQQQRNNYIEKISRNAKSIDSCKHLYINHIKNSSLIQLPFFKNNQNNIFSQKTLLEGTVTIIQFNRPQKLKGFFDQSSMIDEDYQIKVLQDSFSIKQFLEKQTKNKSRSRSRSPHKNQQPQLLQKQDNQSNSNNNSQTKNNEKKFEIMKIELVPFSSKFQDDKILLQAVSDPEIMTWIGNGKPWDQEKIKKNLQWGDQDWQNWEKKQDDKNYEHEYFSWLFFVTYKNKENPEKINQNAIGLFTLTKKLIPKFSREKLYFGRQILHHDFQGYGIGSKVMQEIIWEQLRIHNTKIKNFYNVVSPKNIGAQKMSKKTNGENMGNYNVFGDNYDIFKFTQKN